MKYRKLMAMGSATTLLASLGCAAAAPVDDTAVPFKTADITTMCGTKPVSIALVDGFGGNSWRKISRAVFEDQLAKCANVKRVLYAEANSDQQKYSASINSLVAQNVDVIVTFTDFGDATLPIARKATKDGVVFIPYYQKIAGTAGTDFATQVYMDYAPTGAAWADWLGSTIKSGNVIFLGGTPGAASSQSWLNSFKDGLVKHPGIKLLDENYVVTNWNPADSERAVSALIAKYGKIDAVIADYGVITLGVVKAFQQAGLPVPPQATIGSFNELNCKYLSDKKDGKGWKYLSLDYSNGVTALAARHAIATFEGTRDDEPSTWKFYEYANSETGRDPACDPNAAPDADLSALAFISKEKLNSVFHK